jgi:RNA polymerase sigma factor (sigma-70 family)
MSLLTPELLARLLEAHADALELFAAQWSQSPADIVQEAFVELAGQPVLPRDVVAWLYRVVRNGAISDARSTSRRKRRESTRCLKATAWFRFSDQAAIDSSEATDALRELSEDLREVLVARIWGGLTFEEIGAMTATSASTAFRRYDEALSALRTRLGIACPNDDRSPKG